MTTPVLYSLLQKGPSGEQPYIFLYDIGLQLEGGIVKDGQDYLGLVTGDISILDKVMQGENIYNIRVISKADAQSIYDTSIQDISIKSKTITKSGQLQDFITKIS